MKKLKFEITRTNIREYLNEHREDEFLKNREAMFVRYLKEEDRLTKEKLEMLTRKYNFDAITTDELPTFEEYVKKIDHLDISGICHVLIPILGCEKRIRSCHNHIVSIPYLKLRPMAVEMIGPFSDNSRRKLESALEDYSIAGKIDKFKFNNQSDLYLNIKMSKKTCFCELDNYASIYGKEKVEEIRQKVKERM